MWPLLVRWTVSTVLQCVCERVQLRTVLPASAPRSREGWTEWWWWWCHRGTCEPAPLGVTAFSTASRGPRYQTRCFPPRGVSSGSQSSDPQRPTTFGSFVPPVALAFVPEWLCSRPLWGADTDALLLSTPPRCEPPPACGGSPTGRLSRLPKDRKQHRVTVFSDHEVHFKLFLIIWWSLWRKFSCGYWVTSERVFCSAWSSKCFSETLVNYKAAPLDEILGLCLVWISKQNKQAKICKW